MDQSKCAEEPAQVIMDFCSSDVDVVLRHRFAGVTPIKNVIL